MNETHRSVRDSLRLSSGFSAFLSLTSNGDAFFSSALLSFRPAKRVWTVSMRTINFRRAVLVFILFFPHIYGIQPSFLIIVIFFGLLTFERI